MWGFDWAIFWSVMAAIIASHVFRDILMLAVAAVGQWWDNR